MGIAADIVSGFVKPLEDFMTTGASNLAGDLKGPLIAGAALYLVIFGILILLGYVRAPVQDFVINSLKIAFIVSMVTNIDNYNFYVKDLFFTHLPEGINSSVGKIPGTSVNANDISNGAVFDRVYDKFVSLADTIRKKGSWRNIAPIIFSALFLFPAVIMITALLALVLYAKVILSLVLVLGPLFIAMLLFRVTQPLFSSWLAVALNFVLLQVMMMTSITLFMSIIENNITSTAGNDINLKDIGIQITVILRSTGLLALALYVSLQLPDIAARISGGGIVSGTDLIRSGGNAARSSTGKTAKGIGYLLNKAFGRSGGSIEKKE